MIKEAFDSKCFKAATASTWLFKTIQFSLCVFVAYSPNIKISNDPAAFRMNVQSQSIFSLIHIIHINLLIPHLPKHWDAHNASRTHTEKVLQLALVDTQTATIS